MQSDATKPTPICGLWKTKNGHYHSMSVDQQLIDKLKEVVTAGVGGKLLIRNRSAQAIADSKNPEKAPTAYLEYSSADNEAAFKANKQAPTSMSGI